MSGFFDRFACTVCDSPAGGQLRATIFADDFWVTLASVAAPFPVLLLGLAVFHFGGSSFPARREKQRGRLPWR